MRFVLFRCNRHGLGFKRFAIPVHPFQITETNSDLAKLFDADDFSVDAKPFTLVITYFKERAAHEVPNLRS